MIVGVTWKAKEARDLAEGLSVSCEACRLQASWQGVGRKGAVTKPGIVEEVVWESCIAPQINPYPLTLASSRA